MASGRFITFEGIEGSGKSSQVLFLINKLRNCGVRILATREPGGSWLAEVLRSVILSDKATGYSPRLEAFLFSAARIDHIDKLILPTLQAGCSVVCDRFIDSTRVYQSELKTAELFFLEKLVLGNLYPDLTIVLDLPVDKALRRVVTRRGAKRLDRFEKESEELYSRRRQAFLDIAAAEPDRVMVIDADKPPNEVSDCLWEVVRNSGILNDILKKKTLNM